MGTLDGQTRDAMVSFIGDDKVLKAIELKGGALPQSFSIDLKGVRQLTIKHHGNNGGNIGLAELMIK